MLNSKIDRPVSARHEILKWSVSRPLWQRDALRRIVLNGSITENDITELNQICRANHNLLPDKECLQKSSPFDDADIPESTDSGISVELASIGNLRSVNRLPSDQTIIFKESPGITIIYGDNGTGKSGYARVIKKACRTRGALPEIRSNAFSTIPSSPPSCDIVCRVSGKDYPLIWQDNMQTDPRLANIFVFDASTAENYLEEDNPSIFTPSGLDVLPKLANACDKIRVLFKQDAETIKREITDTAKYWNYNANTPVGKLLTSLNHNTKPDQVETLAGLNETEKQRLSDINNALKSNPKQKAQETRAAAARVKIFAEKTREVCTNLSDDQISTFRKIVNDAVTTDNAAKVFLSGHFDATYFPGTGSETWRKMWEAAKLFSITYAYKDQAFPVISNDARCVFCQQVMEVNTTERFKMFDAFCKDQSQVLAENAKKELNIIKEKLNKINPLKAEYNNVKADLATMPPSYLCSVSQFVTKADECLMAIKNNLTNGVWEEAVSISISLFSRIKNNSIQKGMDNESASKPVFDVISEEASRLEERAKIEESADEPEIRKKLELEQSALTDRNWLSCVKNNIFEQINRYNQLAKLEACIKDTETTSITTKNTDLTKRIVTDVYCQRFQDEVKGLGLQTINVKLEEIKGKKGETKFGVRLEAKANHAVKEIASEGEKRCIALAAFLSELSQASHRSTLVFDDPVSSFDHRFREKTAQRLVQEGKLRQVIVFTHDVVFLNDLITCANNQDVQAESYHLEWNGNMPGNCIKGLPWDWKTADDRLDKLEKEQRSVAKAWNPVPNELNVQSMRRVYSWLRATLERIIEKEVFADVIFRYRSYVNVKRLNDVVNFSAKECSELQRLVQRCHDVTDAHDPAGKHAVIPTPDELKNDIDATKQLLALIRGRRNTQHLSSTQQLGTP